MSKVLLISRNPVLSADLKQQFSLSQNWETVEEYAAETVFDAVVVDEDAAAARDLRARRRRGTCARGCCKRRCFCCGRQKTNRFWSRG